MRSELNWEEGKTAKRKNKDVWGKVGKGNKQTKKCANTEKGLDKVNIKEKEGMKCRDRIYEVQ